MDSYSFQHNPFTQQPTLIGNQSIRFDNKQEATLYLFSPIQKPDAIVRPHDYNFNPDFIGEIVQSSKDMASSAHNGTGFGQFRPNVYVGGMNMEANQAIMPSANAYRFGRRDVNSYYRFMLILTNAPLNSRSRFSQPNLNKIIYTGWCLDEPVSYGGHLNPQCTLVFTHFTHMDVNERVTPAGTNTLVAPRCDCDIIQPLTADIDSNSTSDRDYLLAPEHILDCLQVAEDRDMDGYTSALAPEQATVSRLPQAKTQLAIYNAPCSQLNRIVQGLTKSLLERDGEAKFSSYAGDNNFFVRDNLMSKRRFRENLGGNLSTRVVGPEYQKRVSLGKLMTLYPGIEQSVKLFQIATPQYDLINEEQTDMLSIMSSYLKVAIPPILADHGIASMSFRYTTYNEHQLYFAEHMREPVWDITHAAPFIDEPNDVTVKRVQQAQSLIRNMVFSVVESIAGCIDVLVIYQNVNDTIIQLQLKDHTDLINYGYVLNHGDLGGFASPLIGGPSEFDGGNNMISSVLDTLGNPMLDPTFDHQNFQSAFQQPQFMQPQLEARQPNAFGFI